MDTSETLGPCKPRSCCAKSAPGREYEVYVKTYRLEACNLVLTNLVLIPYNRNPDYIGRSLILETIREIFGYSKSEAARQPRVSLFGLGGVGYV